MVIASTSYNYKIFVLDVLIIRTGTRDTIEIRQLQGVNIKSWEREIKAASRAYVDKVEEALVEIIHNDQTAFLGMHRSEGLKLYTVKDDKRKLEWTKHASNINEIDDSVENTLILKFNDKSQLWFHFYSLYTAHIVKN